MLKSFKVNDINELEQLEQKLYESMDKTLLQINSNVSSISSQTLFSKMKFSGIGFDPLDSNRPLNIIKQINQSFTYLASFYALEVLFTEYPELAPFQLNLGTAPGSDIESECGGLAAEVFAAVAPTSNQKLKKDINKVLATDAKLKFVFFICLNFELGRQPQLEKEGVIVWVLKGANVI
ncbi:hypothetical protein [Psychrobacter sp. Ps6]|uniref:hypothetical protein n=1 Tax=Psychrobacter sp. Ps6 TaxID=2790960 RepID=UPI001EDED4E9|nr:hypothetical protein [Psychrobacter sp. Ps6]MCG3879659.1 hypothetical protein [Psychrobacter sp. Ps6]